jgi:Tfp pilus assembly protein PilF
MLRRRVMRAGADALRDASRGIDPMARGRAALARGDEPEARAAFESALADDPFFAPAHAALAELDRRAGCREAALAHYRTALVRYPSAPELLLPFGLLLAQGGEGEEALRTLERVLELRPGQADAEAALARLRGAAAG